MLLADGSGRDFEVELKALSARDAAGVVLGERPSPQEPEVELALYQSLIRPQRFELVLEKGTEVGVSRFVPLLSGRARVRAQGGGAGESPTQRAGRWRRVVTEAAEQCGRGRVPVVDPPLPFEDAVGSAPGLRLIPWEGPALSHAYRQAGSSKGERSLGLRAILGGLAERPAAVSLLIGPEGGFEADEVELARGAGCLPVSLGPRILRSETAGIVAAALAMHELGEMGG